MPVHVVVGVVIIVCFATYSFESKEIKEYQNMAESCNTSQRRRSARPDARTLLENSVMAFERFRRQIWQSN
jgi:hypothetical protein